MNIKQMLLQYQYIPSQIARLNAELNDIIIMQKETHDNLKAMTISDMPHGTEVGNPTLRAVENIMYKYQERIIFIEEMVNKLVKTLEYVDYSFNCLEGSERKIIELLYFNSYNIGQVSSVMYLCKSRIYELQNSAIDKMQDIIRQKKGA